MNEKTIFAWTKTTLRFLTFCYLEIKLHIFQRNICLWWLLLHLQRDVHFTPVYLLIINAHVKPHYVISQEWLFIFSIYLLIHTLPLLVVLPSVW